MTLDRLTRTLCRAALQAEGHDLPIHAYTDDELLARFADVFAEKPILAIKNFRAVSGLGLKESKEEHDKVRPLAHAAKLRRDGTLTEAKLPTCSKWAAEALVSHIIEDARRGVDDRVFRSNVDTLLDFIRQS